MVPTILNLSHSCRVWGCGKKQLKLSKKKQVQHQWNVGKVQDSSQEQGENENSILLNDYDANSSSCSQDQCLEDEIDINPSGV